MIGLFFSCGLFVVFIACYAVSKQYDKGTGSRLTLELISLGSLVFMALSACAGAMGI